MPELAPAVRGLTVKQPWPWALLQPGGKNIENRTWPIPPALLGATVLLHAGQKVDRDALSDPRITALPDVPDLDDFVTGAIVAHGRLAECHEEKGGCCAPWGDPTVLDPIFHWQIADLRAIEPIPYTGSLSLWHPRPDLDLSFLSHTLPKEEDSRVDEHRH
ncbi:hypothetical protein [Streptomyces muensis]|uniref:ASCH domain-containing protein n=1 Tax=Streptomyces muensis TaxID=1077944 RepID=A0A9X1PUE2_STRM4|nr:hypothetical protein [Streptomyces muensis]MCF1592439.1 hypothetical protein [Streptomyces muensis]